MPGWGGSIGGAGGSSAAVTTTTTTSGAVSPGRLGEFEMREGHAYVLLYRVNAMRTNGLVEQQGATHFADFVYICKWPEGGDPSAEEFGEVPLGVSGAFSLVVVNGIEQVDEETLGRVWIESEGLGGYDLAWRVDVYVLSDREIAA